LKEQSSLLLAALGLATFGTLVDLLDNFLDDTDGDGLLHITDGEAAERSILGEFFDDHGLLGDELDHGGITGLDAGWVLFSGLTGTLVNLGLNDVELASDVAGVAIEDWRVSVSDFTGVVHDDDLGGEVLSVGSGVVLGVRCDVASLDILDGQVLDVETNVVAWNGLLDLLVVHLDGLAFSGLTKWAESDDHTGLQGTSLNTTDGDCADTANLVDILEWETKGLLRWSLWWDEVVKSLKEIRSLVPRHVVRSVDHVIALPAGNGDEFHLLWVVADLLEVDRELRLDFVVTSLGVLDGVVVHLVHADDHLLDTHGLGEESVLTGLAILGETGFEATNIGGNHENGGISLGGTSDHVLDEVSVAWGIDDGEDSVGGLELPESNINGDTTLAFGLELVENPGVLEGTLAHLVGFLLELLNSTGINTTALVDQVTGRGRLAGVDVADDDEVDTILLFSHCVVVFCKIMKIITNQKNTPF